jgi:tetratricopeptide (TPR) repeat protein
MVTVALLSQGIAAHHAAAALRPFATVPSAAPYLLAQEAVPAPAYAAADAAYKAYSRGDYAEAVRKAREAAALAPDNAEYRRLLQTAETALHAADRQRVFNAADAAYKAYSRGDYAEAIRRAREAVALAPDNADYRRLLATAQGAAASAVRERAFLAADRAYKAEARGDYARAVVDAREAVRLLPQDRSYRRLLVDALANAGHLSEAERLASEALAQDPNDGAMLAQRGYVRQRLGRFAAAADDFAAALRAGTANATEQRNIALSLADAALAAKEDQRALDALQPYAGEQSYAVASRQAYALLALDRKDEALAAFVTGAPLATTPQERATMLRAEIGLLTDLGRKDEAKARFAQAQADGSLAAASNLDVAYLAASLGDDKAANARFERARQTNELTGSAILDAAYAAKRSSRNAEAIDYFKAGIDENAAGKLPLSAQALFDARREVAELERSWGAFVTLSYGAVGVMPSSPLAPPLVGGNLLQAGSEIFWRPPVIGNRDNSIFEVFARTFETLSDGTGGPTGAPTLQGAIGARWKPFSSFNLVLEGARVFALGHDARTDWLARVAFSDGQGTDLRVDVPNWTMWQIYAEYDRFFVKPQTVVSFEGRFGRSFRLDPISDRVVVTPFLALGGGYNNLLATPNALGTGPGVAVRWWFREDKYTAPMSYVDLNVQYRFKLAGDNRARGVFVGFTAAY